MSLTTRALWVIERNLDRDLGLRDLAAACNVSPCHLSHAFTERVGRPITHYVRSRRLSCAAEALAAGAPDVLDLALASGYNSHEAFSRAFKALLGVTPERVRHLRTTAGLPVVPAVDMTTIEECALPAPDIRTMGATPSGTGVCQTTAGRRPSSPASNSTIPRSTRAPAKEGSASGSLSSIDTVALALW